MPLRNKYGVLLKNRWLLLALLFSIAAGSAYALQTINPTATREMAATPEAIEGFEAPSDLYGPFDESLTVDSQFAYLVVPRSLSTAHVLEEIEKVSGKRGALIQEDVTVLAPYGGDMGKLQGDLYQYLPGEYDALTAALGGGVVARAGMISTSTDKGIYDHSGFRFLTEEGEDFMVYTQYDGGKRTVIYTEHPLPDLVTQCIEGECEAVHFLHLDLERGIFVVGYAVETNPLFSEKRNIVRVYRKEGEVWQRVIDRELSRVRSKQASGQLVALASPDRSILAISDYVESYFTEEELPASSHFLLHTDTLVLKEITLPESLFPTFWSSTKELLYGYAVGKDCGYYPHEVTYDLNTDTARTVQERDPDGAWYEKYLFPYGTVYSSSRARVAETTYRSPITYGASMCDEGETAHSLTILNPEGGERALFKAPDGTYLRSVGFIDEHAFVVAVTQITGYEMGATHDGRPVKVITSAGKPEFKSIDVRTGAVTRTTREAVLARRSVTQDEYRYIRMVDKSTIDMNFTTLILKIAGKPIDRLDFRSYTGEETSRADYEALGEGAENVYETIGYLE